MLGRRRYFGRTFISRLFSLFLVISLCASFFFLSVVRLSPAEKDGKEPFPCQNRPCGCNSAHQCWKQCCCFTHTQKLAWAQAHGVTPPAFVVAAAKAEANREQSLAAAKPRPCCAEASTRPAEKSLPACCTREKADVSGITSSCCSPGRASEDKFKARDKEENENTRGIILVAEVQKCHGQGLYGTSLPWAVLPVIETSEIRDVPPSWDHPCSMSVLSLCAEPPEPPPRLA